MYQRIVFCQHLLGHLRHLEYPKVGRKSKKKKRREDAEVAELVLPFLDDRSEGQSSPSEFVFVFSVHASSARSLFFAIPISSQNKNNKLFSRFGYERRIPSSSKCSDPPYCWPELRFQGTRWTWYILFTLFILHLSIKLNLKIQGGHGHASIDDAKSKDKKRKEIAGKLGKEMKDRTDE